MTDHFYLEPKPPTDSASERERLEARAEIASHNEIILAQGDTIARMRNEQADMQLEFGAEVERLTVELDAAVKMLGRIGEAAGPPHGDRNVTLATVQRMRPVVEAALWVRDHQYGEHAANHEQLLAAIRAAVDAYCAQEVKP